MISYKGYSGSVVFDDEDDILHGEIIGIRDVVTFQGKSVAELRKAFKESVDDYLEFCQARGEAPEKPLSGRFVLRVSPKLHHDMYVLARQSRQSLNGWIAARLEREVARLSGPGEDSESPKTGKKPAKATRARVGK